MMVSRVYYRITWRGFSGRLRKFKPKVFKRDDWLCYVDKEGNTRKISFAMMGGLESFTPCRKRSKKK